MIRHLLTLSLLSFSVFTAWAQPGVDDHIYTRAFVYHEDRTLCYHVPPQASFVVFLNGQDSILLTEESPRWAPGAPANISGNGIVSVELGNFVDPSVAVGDSFTLIFTCEATCQQGRLKGIVPEVPWSGFSGVINLSSSAYLPSPQEVQVVKEGDFHKISWRFEPGIHILIYRRDPTDTLSNGLPRYQYQKIAEVYEDSTYVDSTATSSCAYILMARDDEGRISGHSPERAILSPILGLQAHPRCTTVELRWQGLHQPGLTAVGYNIYRRQPGQDYGPPVTYSDTDTFYTDDRLSPNTTYYYQIRARNLIGREIAVSDEISITTNSYPELYTCFTSIRVLVVIYTNTSGGEIPAQDIPKIREMIEEARLFYWRNSGFYCNLDLSYMVIDDYRQIDPGDYSTSWVEEDLHTRGVHDEFYDAVFRISPVPDGYWSWGVTAWPFMGPAKSTAFSHSDWPVITDVKYPKLQSGINYKLTWVFTHEFQHALDGIYEHNGHPEMAHGDVPWEFNPCCGEHFDFQAQIFRHFHAWLSLSPQWGQILESEDQDGDGLPDNDPRVPLDEVRFGSDSTKPDTDEDGLTDFEEAIAGIYGGSNPTLQDTDGDGLSDGQDPLPFYPMDPDIPRFTPKLDGTIEQGWHLLIDGLHFSTTPYNCKIYMNWDNNYLYFAFELGHIALPGLFLDAKADGWWHSRDNYELVINPHSGELYKAHVLDCTSEALDYRHSIGRGKGPLWDDDPSYISHFGRIIYPSGFQIARNQAGNGFTVEVAIPRNPRSGLEPSVGDSLRLRFCLEKLNNSWAHWGTAFEHYSFVTVKLVEGTQVAWEKDASPVPASFELSQNFPNPFNTTTTIQYQLPKESKVRIVIYNPLGQQVRVLMERKLQAPGTYLIFWDGKDGQGWEVASGVYLCQLQAGEFVQTRKIVVMR